MTVFTHTWNAAFKALPADTDDFSAGATRMRELRTAISERLVVDHSWAGNTSDGEHLQVSFAAPISTPTGAANKGFLYMKDVSSKAELHYLDEDSDEVQLTSGGAVLNAALSVTTGMIAANAVTGSKLAMGSDAQGDVLFYGGTDYERLAAGVSGLFLKTQGSSADPIWSTVPAVFTESYDSGEQTIAFDSSLTVAHSLSGVPKLVQVYIKCKSAENGYAVDDLVTTNSSGDADFGSTAAADATNIQIATGVGVRVVNQTTFNNITITAASWRYIIRAFF
jgi:hypothetical protein